MNDIYKQYAKLLNIVHPITGEHLNEKKIIKHMYDIVMNNHYDIIYTIEDRIIASKLITVTLENSIK